MAYQQPYVQDTFRPTTDQGMPGNENDPNPVEFDLAPAQGEDIAHIKSMLVATIGLTSDNITWTEEAQNAIVSAFRTGAPAFISTVEAVRNYSVPAVLAKRVGFIQDYPTFTPAGTNTPQPNKQAKIPILSGLAWSKVCGFNLGLSLHLCRAIMDLTRQSGTDIRFFEPPSGSGSLGTPNPQTLTAADAVSPPDASETAASETKAAKRVRGSSRRAR